MHNVDARCHGWGPGLLGVALKMENEMQDRRQVVRYYDAVVGARFGDEAEEPATRGQQPRYTPRAVGQQRSMTPARRGAITV